MTCPVIHIWQDDFGEYEIPPALFRATRFRKDGMPDKRFRRQNYGFMLWLADLRRNWT